MATYVSSLRLQLFDNDEGAPLSDGYVYFYASGTSTLSTRVYTDSTGTLAENPVRLSSSGSAVIFLDPIAYRVYITDVNGNMIADLDPWYGPGYSSTGIGGDGTLAIVSSYAAFRALSSDYSAVLILGRSSVADGGQGIFVKNGPAQTMMERSSAGLDTRPHTSGCTRERLIRAGSELSTPLPPTSRMHSLPQRTLAKSALMGR